MVGAKEYPKKKEACRSLTHQGHAEWFGGVIGNEVGWEHSWRPSKIMQKI